MKHALVRILFLGTLAGALLLLPRAPAGAQAVGTITGTVTDANSGVPLSGAGIELEGRLRPAPTDADGRYTVTDVPVGQVTIRVRLIGYGAAGQTMTVAAGQTVTADFQISRSAVSRLPSSRLRRRR